MGQDKEIIIGLTDLNFYRLNSEYRGIRDKIIERQKAIYDLDVMKIKLERKLLDLNDQIRKIEVKVLNDLDKRR